MTQVAKVLIRNNQNQFLLMIRSDHPTFPNDPDLPGGTIDPGETPKIAAIREVMEEAGIELDAAKVALRTKDTTTSAHGTEYYVYETQLNTTPNVAVSWEHESYRWVSREKMIAAGYAAKDTFMQLVAKNLEG